MKNTNGSQATKLYYSNISHPSCPGWYFSSTYIPVVEIQNQNALQHCEDDQHQIKCEEEYCKIKSDYYDMLKLYNITVKIIE